MKPKNIVIALAVIAIAGTAILVGLNFQRGAERKRSTSAPQTVARELASEAKSFVRDLAGRNPSELSRTTRHILELVPMGTPLDAARQTMAEHQFVCSVDSYTNPAQMSNSTIWNTAFVKGGQRLPVTNVARLKCETNGCAVTLWLVNGETTSLSVQGRF
jgi:hypothetical protein